MDYEYGPNEMDETAFAEMVYDLMPVPVKCLMCCGTRTASQRDLERAGWVLGPDCFCPVDAVYAEQLYDRNRPSGISHTRTESLRDRQDSRRTGVGHP